MKTIQKQLQYKNAEISRQRIEIEKLQKNLKGAEGMFEKMEKTAFNLEQKIKARDTQIEKLKDEDVKKTLLINKYLERADGLKELVKLYKGIVHFDDETITDNSSIRNQIAQLEKEIK